MTSIGQQGPRGRFDYVPDAVGRSELLGLAARFSPDEMPVNGLRHPRTAQTCGWYVWSSEEIPIDDDGFRPTHVGHLLDRCPDAGRYLELPPGWRFLIAPGHEDIWFDESLTDV